MLSPLAFHYLFSWTKNSKILAFFRSWFLSNVPFREPSWKKRNTKDIIIGVPEPVIIMTLQPHRHTCGDFVMGTPLFARLTCFGILLLLPVVVEMMSQVVLIRNLTILAVLLGKSAKRKQPIKNWHNGTPKMNNHEKTWPTSSHDRSGKILLPSRMWLPRPLILEKHRLWLLHAKYVTLYMPQQTMPLLATSSEPPFAARAESLGREMSVPT